MGALLEGAVVRRVDLAAGVAALEVRLPGESVVVLVGFARGARGVGLVSSEARRKAWGTRLPAGVTRSRSDAGTRIEGGRVIGVSVRGVLVERNGEHRSLVLEGARAIVRDGELEVAGEDERAAFEARGAALLEALAVEALERRRHDAVRVLERAITKIERRIAATTADLARLADAELLAAQASWLIAEAVKAPRGARSLTVTDWTSGEARELVVPLDPAKPARVQVEAMFQRARRLKRGAKIAEGRIAKAESVRDALRCAAEGARDAPDLERIDAALHDGRAAAPRDVKLDGAPAPTAGSGKTAERSSPYRTFVTAAGARILVGKGAAQNDRLTFQTARPHDLWLHAKGYPGAHVIVPLAKNASCPADVLVDAAHLAAHFSDARGETLVEVHYTPRRYLRKPRGSAPGLAVVDREKVLAVRLEPGRVEKLLEAEE